MLRLIHVSRDISPKKTNIEGAGSTLAIYVLNSGSFSSFKMRMVFMAAPNGETNVSDEGYTKANCLYGINLIKWSAIHARIEHTTLKT